MDAEHNLQMLGRSKIGDREAEGFRYSYFDAPINRNYSYEFWLDVTTKLLVKCKDPGDDIFGPSEIVLDVTNANGGAIEYKGEKYMPIKDVGGQPGNSGHIIQDIRFDKELDDSLFRLEAPEGFTVIKANAPESPKRT